MNRSDLKKYYQRLRQGQQNEFVGNNTHKANRMSQRLLKETRGVTIGQIRDAAYELQSNDPGQIATYLGAHEDEVRDMMAYDDEVTNTDTSPDYDQQLNVGMFLNNDEHIPIGGGLGRGKALAEENLKNALSDLYQEVVDAEEDEIDPADYSLGSSMDMMGNANFEAVRSIKAIVANFLKDKI